MARGATGMVPRGIPQGGYPRPVLADRYVMRLTDPVRVLGSMNVQVRGVIALAGAFLSSSIDTT